jgi:hypothetical protein
MLRRFAAFFRATTSSSRRQQNNDGEVTMRVGLGAAFGFVLGMISASSLGASTPVIGVVSK